MTPVLIGYFPKRRTKAPSDDWFAGTAALEICSVSHHIAPAPPDWLNHWLHNTWSAFNSPALALQTIPSDSSEFDLVAWLLYPVRFHKGQRLPFPLSAPTVQSLPADTQHLGYDLVSASESRFDAQGLRSDYLEF